MAVGLNNSLTFGGINSANYGIFIDGGGVYNSPERDVTLVTIPGRSGQLVMDNGRFENIEVTYSAFIDGRDDGTIRDSIRDFRNAIGALRGYQRLEDTYNPDEFRQALFIGGLEVDPVVYQTGGEFEITFNCKPQRWLKSGEELLVFTEATTLTNPTLFASEPLIRVSGSDGTVAINDITIGVAQLPAEYSGQELYIDCEIGDAYCYDLITNELVNLNSYVSWSEYPRLDPGANAISFTNYLTRVSVIPRWWRV